MSRRWEQTSLIGELQDFEHFFPNKEVADKGYKAESVAKWPWDSTTAYYSEYSDVLGRNIRRRLILLTLRNLLSRSVLLVRARLLG